MKIGLLVVPILSLALFSACSKKEEPKAVAVAAAVEVPGLVTIAADSPKLKQIKVEVVVEKSVPTHEVVAPGKVELNPNRVARISLPVAGRISTFSVRIGDTVKQGQVVMTVESSDSDAAMATQLQAQAQINQAKANLLKAQTDYDRVKDLFEHNAIAKKEVLNAENAIAQNTSVLEQAEAMMKQAQRRLEILGLKAGQFGQKIAVAAPISGKVMDITAAQGEFKNDTNQAVITIADLSSVWVASDVPESSIRFIQVGERFDIELTAFPNEVFHARVTRIADTVDPQTRTIKVRAEMDNLGGRFRPEMFGNIRHVESVQNMPVVPVGAVIQAETQSSVWLELAPGKFQLTKVTLANRMQDTIGIASGLKAGDRVVTDGVMLLKGN